MPNTVTIRTGCKINLFLRILAARADGLHELETLFIPLDEPHDEMLIRPGRFPGLRLTCTSPEVDPRRNTLTKAHALWRAAAGQAPDLEVLLIKGVPSGAGLGGGSADAAGLLLFLQHRAEALGQKTFSPSALNALAAEVGADVPFFLLNRPALAGGIGERLTETANPLADKHLALLSPKIHISTAWAFSALDVLREDRKFSAQKNLTSTGPRDNTCFSRGEEPGNDLEEVVFHAFPEFARLRDELLEQGAEVARMSGSGSSIFGVFAERERAERAVAAMPHQGWVASFAGA